MFTAIKGLFSSNVVLGYKICLALGIGADQALDIAGYIAGLFGIKGIQQGMSDWGKSSK